MRSPERRTLATTNESDHLLANDYFRISHHDQSGDLRLHPDIAGLGLASALLGELLWEDKIALEDNRLIWYDQSAPRTALTHRILEQIVHEPTALTVPEWLRYLSIDAHDLVAQRLLDANQVAQVQKRKGFRRFVTYEPADSNEWVWIRVNIADSLNKRRPMPPMDVHLAGLAKVTNLLGDVMTYYDGASYLDRLLPRLPPAVVELLGVTGAVVQQRVLSGR